MRAISDAGIAAITSQYGADPVIIIGVQWVIGGPVIFYADRDITLDDGSVVPGKIDSMDTIDDTIQIDSGGDSKQVNIVMSDTDGSIKLILDTIDIHKRACYVYQSFDGLSWDDKFLLFKGEISTPIVWDEGDRTVSFDVISIIEDAEVGFSIEEGQFPILPADLVGKPWPMVFGSVLNCPSLRINSPRQGTLATSFGISDFTLPSRIALAKKLFCSPTYVIGYAVSNPVQEDPNNPTAPTNAQTPIYGVDPNCKQKICVTQEDLNFQLAQQLPYEFSQLTIYGGSQFQQGTLVGISVGGAHLTGTFNGDVFTVITRLHPDIVNLGCTDVPCAIAALQAQQIEPGTILSKCPGGPDIGNPNDVSARTFAALDAFPTAEFVWINAGETVTFAFDEEVIYVVNIIPSQVIRISAFRTLTNNQRLLLTVPEEFYSVETADYTSYTVTQIVLPRALSELGQGWEDDIFVTQTSSVGPNMIDIMKFLISTYTDFTWDDDSFNHVRAAVDNYPMHFPMLERKNILTMLQEMAYQGRCSIYLRGDVFFITYLSEEPDAVAGTINQEDIDHRTLQLTHTATEDLITKYIASWIEDQSNTDVPNEVILRQNVIKYGTQELDYDYYCYNIQDLVTKSATFWLIRNAYTYRKVLCSTSLNLLQLEPLDYVNLNIPALSDQTVTGIVNQATYNADTNTIDFEIWTPVLSGTTVPYAFAFPGTADSTITWPPQDEIDQMLVGSGDAPGFKTIAPPGSLLSTQQSNQANLPGTGAGQQNIITGPGACEGSSRGSLNYGFCCGPVINEADFCEQQQPESTNDSRDSKPAPKRAVDNTGEINTGDEPKIDDGIDQVVQGLKDSIAASQGQKSADTANSANEAADGSGSGGDPDRPQPKNPFKGTGTGNPPTKAKGPDGKDKDPDKPACTTVIVISWFSIRGEAAAGTQGGIICVPAGGTITETFKYAGGGECGRTPEPPLCDGGYINGPCCHFFKSCVSPDPAGCAELSNQGELLDYSATQNPGDGSGDQDYDGPSAYQGNSGSVNPGPGL